MRDVAGDASNLLITDAERGSALAKVLGDAELVLMRGHGDTTVGPSVKLATARAIFAEANARIQLDALKLGQKVTYLSAGEIASLNPMNANERAIAREWEFWRHKAIGK
jgi:HCOMODA/2-hydroxy-3-carboxy-muconic semialdehyde decarboxylase